ncbi:MAG: FliM/FliN family flagellar motor switch protein [Sphingomonadales bacterium]|nr:FliM/FliN family flagellar motor switch protein [Sphingomonadales bacterium]
MKPERSLVAERALARHCPELLRGESTATATDTGPELARLSVRLARALAKGLGPMLGGGAPAVTCAEPRTAGADALVLEIAPFAANCLLAVGRSSAPLLASLDAGAALRIVDRAFGGRGEAPDPLPEAFPLSAELMIARIEAQIAACLAEAAGLIEADAVRPLRRDASLAQLAPFPDATPLTLLVLNVEETGHDPWEVILALPAETVTALLGAEAVHATPAQAARGPASPQAEPYAAMPLPLAAVIVDMRVPFATLAGLTPGMVLPVSVARNVPLRIGDRTIGHGTVGAVDDRVAVQINQIF